MSLRVFLLAALLFAVLPLHAQRQPEPLGRGVVALRTSTTQTYIGWRLLGGEPTDLAFNLYRSVNNAAPVKLNSSPLLASTNYLDTPGSTALASPITYTVVPVLAGVEIPDGTPPAPGSAYLPVATASSSSFTVPPASASGRRYFTLPLSTPTPNPASTAPYDVKFCWVGDFDGDGEYDFLVNRQSTAAVEERQYLEAYRRDGTFLWRMDLGPNSVEQYLYEPGSSAIAVGDTDNVTVFDLDGDGLAEVAVRTARGVTVTNASGAVVATVTASTDTAQFVSIFSGLTGAELARAPLPNPFAQHGTLTNKCAVAFLDGLRPSVVFYGYNRADSEEFYRAFTAFDYRAGALVQRWHLPQDPRVLPGSEGHQIRVADVDNDGRDEIIDLGHVIDDDGRQLYVAPELTHGDRFHVADLDPDRPGLETYAIQQYNPGLLATAYFSSATGSMIRRWYATDVVDVGRGIALDITPAHKGCEMYSTQAGIYNAKAARIYENNVWAPEGLWWDGDLLREFIDGAGSGALSPVVNKFNPATGVTDRLYTFYTEGGGTHQAFGGRPSFWGDLFGDWREEIVVVANDFASLRIYTTTTVAPSRLYTLMHNPAYRMQATTKGYVQASNVDYYLGVGMAPPPPPPIVPARLAWSATTGPSTWDASSAANPAAWRATATSAPSPFAPGDTVRFDLAGNASAPVALSGELRPAALTVYSPGDYTFDGASGSLAGPMPFVKSGRGTLRLTGTHPYTGPTTIWDGALRLDGTLAASPVTVWGGTWGGPLARGLTGGRLSGSGTVSAPVSLRDRATLAPGPGMSAPGTLTLGAGLAAADSSTLAFDLSTDPSGATLPNDRLAITGPLTLSGTVTLLINPLSGSLAPGSYTLATYTGPLTGSAANLSVIVPDGTPYTLSLGSGALVLTIPVTRPATTVTWTGNTSATWDIAATPNWAASGSPTPFVSGDHVLFDATGSARPSLTLGVAAPVSGLTFTGSVDYTLSGPGSVSGPGGLTKSGPATVTLSGTHAFTGPVSLTGGILAVDNLADGGLPSSLGASPSAPANLVLDGATLRLTGPQTNTNRSLTLGSSGGTLDIAVSNSSLQLSGALAGPGRLVKTGPGTLILANASTHAGGLRLESGTLVFASDLANTSAPGPAGVTLAGGTLRLYDNIDSYNTSAWPIHVPASASARLETDSRSTLSGPLTGSGTLDLFNTFVRTDITGNWSAFSGVLGVSTDSDGGDLRLMHASGLPAARLHLSALTTAVYNTPLSANTTYPLGALSGAVGSRLSGSITAGRTLTWQIGARAEDTTFSGLIQNGSGPAALTKVGPATLTLTAASNYTGPTAVDAGRLVLAGASLAGTSVTVAATAAFGGTGTVTGNVAFASGATLLAAPAAGPLAITGDLTLSGPLTIAPAPGAALAPGVYPLFTYTGALAGAPALSWSGPGFTATFDTSVPGQVSITLATPPRAPAELAWTGAASATWDGSTLNFTAPSGPAAFQGGDTVRFDDSSSVLTVALSGSLAPAAVLFNTAKNYTLNGTGSLNGPATLEKSGSGHLTLATAQSFTGGTTLIAGTLTLGHASALGAGPVTLSGGTLATGTLTPNNSLVIAGAARITGGHAGGGHGIKAVSGSGQLTLEATNVFDLEGSLAAFSGGIALTGTGGFRFFGGSGSATAAWDLGTRSLGARSGTAFTLGSLSGAPGSVLSGSTGSGNNAAVTYTVGPNDLSTTFSGVLADGNAPASLVKQGSGTLTLAAASTYTGPTTVSAGSLLVTGSLAATPVAVSPGATFGGPGSLAGSLAFASGSTLALAATPAATRGPSTTAAATLAGNLTLTPVLLGAPLAPGTYTALSAASLTGTATLHWSDPTSSGLVASLERTATQLRVTLRTPLQAWRLTHFGSDSPASDGLDPDADGLPNLLEYALNTSPLTTSVTHYQLQITNNHLELTFLRARPDILYEVLASSDLLTWSVIATNPGTVSTTIPVTVADPATSPRRFLRLRVTTTSP